MKSAFAEFAPNFVFSRFIGRFSPVFARLPEICERARNHRSWPLLLPGSRKLSVVLLPILLFTIVCLLSRPTFLSEYSHAAVPVLWLTWLACRRRTRLSTWPVLSLLTVMLLLSWCFLSFEARQLGGTVTWSEPFLWLYFLASLALIWATICSIVLKLLDFPGHEEVIPTMLQGSPAGFRRILLCGLITLLLTPYLVTAGAVHRYKVVSNTNPQQAYGLRYEEVTFPADNDGLRLSGWFIPREGSDTVVLLCHGYGTHKGRLVSMVPFLHRAGLSVFTFDFRGHGDSTGRTISFGAFESRDVRGAVRYLREQRRIRHIVAYGFSQGGASLLNAMPVLPEVEGLIIDGTFSTLASAVGARLTLVPARMYKAIMLGVDASTRLELSLPLTSIAPRRCIKQVSPRPLLVIHGLSDSIVAPSEAQLNFAAALAPKELWLVPHAGHTQPANAHFVARQEFERRIVRFIRRCREDQHRRAQAPAHPVWLRRSQPQNS